MPSRNVRFMFPDAQASAERELGGVPSSFPQAPLWKANLKAPHIERTTATHVRLSRRLSWSRLGTPEHKGVPEAVQYL